MTDAVSGFAEGKVVLFIELPKQIKLALDALNKLNIHDCQIIALSPHVEYALEKLGHSYKTPESYHNERDINLVGLKDEENVGSFCDAADTLLEDKWPLLSSDGIKVARLNWFYLKLLFNTISIRAFILKRIFERDMFDHVLYFGTKQETIGRDLVFMHESAWSRMIPLISGQIGCKTYAISNQCDPTVLSNYRKMGSWGPRERARKLTKWIIGPRMLAAIRGLHTYKFRKRFWLAAFQGRSQNPPPNIIIALDNSHSLKFLLAKIAAKGRFNILRWTVDPLGYPFYLNNSDVFHCGYKFVKVRHELISQAENVWLDFKTNSSIREYFVFSGFDCFSVIEGRLKRLIEKSSTELVHTYLTARRLLQSVKPEVILTSTMGDYGPQSVALAAQKEVVPFIVYRHGDSSGHVQMKTGIPSSVQNTDLGLPSHVLALGCGDVEFFATSRRKYPTIIPVGSADIDDLKTKLRSVNKGTLVKEIGLDPSRKVVVYVTTDMESNLRVAPYRNRSPSLSFLMQRRFLKVFSEFPDIQFVFKLHLPVGHPCSPIVDVIRDGHFGNCFVNTEPLRTVIPIADMFVTDYPSTSFLETLATDRPILVCGHEMPKQWAPDWHPSVLAMWNQRVQYKDDLNDFLELLRYRLNNQCFEPVKSDNTLLKLFGTYLDDGKSVERSEEFIESLTSKSGF